MKIIDKVKSMFEDQPVDNLEPADSVEPVIPVEPIEEPEPVQEPLVAEKTGFDPDKPYGTTRGMNKSYFYQNGKYYHHDGSEVDPKDL